MRTVQWDRGLSPKGLARRGALLAWSSINKKDFKMRVGIGREETGSQIHEVLKHQTLF
jgi:hypothetical protein